MIEQIRTVRPATTVSVDTNPTKIVSNGNRRFMAFIQNTHGSTTLKVGSSTAVAGAGATLLAAGQIMPYYGRGELYAQASSGSLNVRVVEVMGPSNLADTPREYVATITSAPQELFVADEKRMWAIVENDDSTNPMVIGAKGVTMTTGISIAAGEFIALPGGASWWAIAGGTNEVQTLTFTGSASAGTYDLTYGNFTSVIAYNANAAAIQAGLELNPLLAGNVVVAGTGPFTVTFQGALAATNVTQITSSDTNLTGATLAVTTTTPGVSHSISASVREERRF